MASYKIANIKYLRDLGWEIADTYSDSFCPTYSDIADIPISGIASVTVNSTCTATSAAYSSTQLVCEADITVTLCDAPDILLTSEVITSDKTVNLNFEFKRDVRDFTVILDDGRIYGQAHQCDNTDGVIYAYQLGYYDGSDRNRFKEIYVSPCIREIEKYPTPYYVGVFYGAENVTSVTLSEGLEIIGRYAFGWNTSLTSVTIPSTVTFVGDDAFYHCDSLTNVVCKATTPPESDGANSIFRRTSSNEGFTVYVPSGSVEAYKAATGWNQVADKIQAIP